MLEAIISHYTEGNKAKFANLLGVSAQTISAWGARNTFDAELIYTKCSDVSADWLLSGIGSMLRCNQEQSTTQTGTQITQSEFSSNEAMFYCKMYEKKDAEVGILKEEIGALKQKISQLEAGNLGGKKTAKDAPIKKPSSPNADNATSVTVP